MLPNTQLLLPCAVCTVHCELVTICVEVSRAGRLRSNDRRSPVGLTWSLFSCFLKTSLKLPEFYVSTLLGQLEERKEVQLLTVDLLARASMKNAASCDK